MVRALQKLRKCIVHQDFGSIALSMLPSFRIVGATEGVLKAK